MGREVTCQCLLRMGRRCLLLPLLLPVLMPPLRPRLLLPLLLLPLLLQLPERSKLLATQ